MGSDMVLEVSAFTLVDMAEVTRGIAKLDELIPSKESPFGRSLITLGEKSVIQEKQCLHLVQGDVYTMRTADTVVFQQTVMLSTC